jgi:excisionase family DNA binding protein
MEEIVAMISETREEPEVLSFAEAAKFLKVSVRTLRRWVAEKRVPHAKVGGLVRFRRQALLDWLVEAERQTMKAEERAERVRAAHGALAQLPESMDEVAQRGCEEIDLEERAARIRAARGALAHLRGSVDDFLQRKHEEIDLEDRRFPPPQR